MSPLRLAGLFGVHGTAGKGRSYAGPMADDPRMEPQFSVPDTSFTLWLFDRARESGWDLDDTEVKGGLRLIAALVRTGHADQLNMAKIAENLGVSLQELREAYAPDLMASREAAEVFEFHPDLAEVNDRLDEIGYGPDPAG